MSDPDPPPRRRGALRLVLDAAREFSADGCASLAAALSYYTIFSLPPFLVLLLLVLGAVLDPEDVRGALEGQIQGLVGPSGGEIARTLLQQAELPGRGGLVATLLGAGALIVGATGAFGQLQVAMNRVWEVQPDPEQGGLWNFLGKRAFSMLLILGVAFFLLVSLAVSAGMSMVGERAAGALPSGLSEPVLHAIHLAISFAVITLLFGAMLRYLPDVELRWRDVWFGAVVTAFLFVIGKFAIGLYLGRSNPGEAYGAAASLAVLLVWIYYASMIVLFGAEFTQVWTRAHRGRVEPEPGAVVVREVVSRDRAAPARARKAPARGEPVGTRT